MKTHNTQQNKTQTMKKKTKTAVSSRKDKAWLRSRDQLKTRKIFSIMAERNPDGSFRLLGGNQKVLIRKNAFASEWVNVDTRDLCTEIRNSKFHSY